MAATSNRPAPNTLAGLAGLEFGVPVEPYGISLVPVGGTEARYRSTLETIRGWANTKGCADCCGMRNAAAHALTPPQPPGTIGERIAAARKAKGMRPIDLALAGGISKGYLSQIEKKGGEGISAMLLVRIADALSVSIDSLLGREDRP